MTNAFANISQSDFKNQIMKVLPPSSWGLWEGPVLGQLIDGLIAATMATYHADLANISEVESDPRLAAALLPDWLTAFGLPDSCITETLTNDELHAMLLAKMTGIGGQSIDYFIQVAAALGYAITITETKPFLCGDSTYGICGYPCQNDLWRFVWTVHATEDITVTYFTVGTSTAGTPLESWGTNSLECTFDKLKPANTIVLFEYTE